MESISGYHILVGGIVQGVGFRPYVYTLAQRYQLAGWVRNTSSGVEIEVEGKSSNLDKFILNLRNAPPPLAKVDSFSVTPQTPNGYASFEIIHSVPGEGDFIPISADITICSDCRRELLDPSDRRYRYPFINCTNCGPRFTIIQDIPYDRAKTTMSGFEMCPDCQREYNNPLDRRFHAQPTACPVCGPQIWFKTGGEKVSFGENALQAARALLAEGKILAIKGLGGFHLACDAANISAVSELRKRKRRTEKPFALMTYNLDQARKYCKINEIESGLMSSHQHPIILLDRLPDSESLGDVAPGQSTLGIMLPYTPLHLLLLEPSPGFPNIFVMTSGNLSEEPIAYQDQDARQRLTGLADGFLFHNRPIHMRVDDSVGREYFKDFYPLRRSRGYAPDAIRLKKNIIPILAVGGELKNVFCLTRDKYAFLSHHIGDMENYETLSSFEQGVEHYKKLFRIEPRVIACDLHPNYLASRYAEEKSTSLNLPLVKIQHHHAHLAACLAENGWDSSDSVMGFIFDGTGYGEDGAIWGGEVLTGGYSDFQRRFHLKYSPLPGGDISVKKPARMALAHLWSAGIDWDTGYPPYGAICYEEQMAVRIQMEKRINAPLTSSMGRLFDAVSSLVGLRHRVTYEGQAAIELEALADPDEMGWYEFDLIGKEMDPAPLLTQLLADWKSGMPIRILSARFHNSIVHLVVDLAKLIHSQLGINSVALSGGVWQNMRLLRHTQNALQAENFNVLHHRQVPTNDGGIALGQALIASRKMG